MHEGTKDTPKINANSSTTSNNDSEPQVPKTWLQLHGNQESMSSINIENLDETMRTYSMR